MTKLSQQLVCDNLKTLQPYESARRLFSGGQDWLNANESPFANPYQLDASKLNRYPDCQPEQVISAYAAYAGVEKTQTLVTRGADEGIELLIRAFCTPSKDAILICPPTYGMYAISAETCNVGIEKAPLNQDFSLNVEAINAYRGKVKLVFICSPNNPTGTSVDPIQLRQVLEHYADSALVVVDEAYMEFDAANNWASALAEYANLVVLRTLSKAFALAGLRCGFTLAADDVIQILLKVIAPYPIPEPVAQIAQQALSQENLARLQQQVDYLQQEKARLKKILGSMAEISLEGDDKANFLLFRSTDKDQLMQYLISNGMLIRDQSKQATLDNCLRISIGSQEQNDRFIALLTDYFNTKEHLV